MKRKTILEKPLRSRDTLCLTVVIAFFIMFPQDYMRQLMVATSDSARLSAAIRVALARGAWAVALIGAALEDHRSVQCSYRSQSHGNMDTCRNSYAHRRWPRLGRLSQGSACSSAPMTSSVAYRATRGGGGASRCVAFWRLAGACACAQLSRGLLILSQQLSTVTTGLEMGRGCRIGQCAGANSPGAASAMRCTQPIVSNPDLQPTIVR